MFARKLSVRTAAVIAALVVSLSGVAQAAWAGPIVLPPTHGGMRPIVLPPTDNTNGPIVLPPT